MNKAKKIAHLADIHIRKSPSRHDEYRYVFNNLYISLKKEKPDRIVIVGDLNHDYIDMQGEQLILASEFLNNLTSIAPVRIIRGNHDLKRKALTRTDSIEAIVKTIKNPDIVYYNETGFFDDDDIEITWAVWKHGERNNSPWRKRTKSYNKNNIVIDLFHDPVRGCKTATGFEMKQQTYIRSTELKGNYAFLGDIHKQQYLNDEKTIAYPSSLIAQNFGEGDGDFHGYILWEFNGDNASSKLIPIKNDYSYNTVTLNVFTDFDELDFDIDNTTKYNNIRIKWQTLPGKNNEENKRKVVDYINSYIKSKNQKIILLTHKVEFVEENTINKIEETDLDLDNISLQDVQHEIFEEYLEKIGVDQEKIEEIIKLDDEISKNIETEDFTNIEWSIIKFSGKNFMSYEDINIDWKDLDGLFQITGFNTAGKTTIIKIISYILYNKTKETETRMKAGDSRYVNNRNGALFCEGTMVIEVNGQYYGIKRKTEIQKNKAGELIGAPTTLNYYRLNSPDDILDDEVNNIDSLTDNDKKQTQKIINRAIGSYDNFTRAVMTTSDTLNEILSNEKAKFIDALLYDSGLDIFDAKLSEFKEYQKKINSLPRVHCNIEKTREDILSWETEINGINNQIKEIEQVNIPNINERIKKGEDFIEKLRKKLYKIDDEIYNLNVDQVKEQINLHNQQISELLTKEQRLNKAVGELKFEFNVEKYNSLKQENEKIINLINKLKFEIKEWEQKKINKQHDIEIFNGQILQLKKEGNNCKEEITELKGSKNCPTCGQLMTEEHQKHINEKIKAIEKRMYEDIAPQIKTKQLEIPKHNETITDIIHKIGEVNNNIDTLNDEGVVLLEKIGELENDRQEVEKRKELQAQLDRIPIEKKNIELQINMLEKNLDLYEKSKKQIEENHKIEEGLIKAKEKLSELNVEKDFLKDDIYAKNTERGQKLTNITDANELIDKFIEQERQDEIMSIYKKCIHRDGIPTQLLVNKAIPKINHQLNELLYDVPFSVWLDVENLNLKLAYNNRLDAVIDAISASGKERTFSAIALKYALNRINGKSKPTMFLLDEVMGKLTDDSVDEFIMVLHAIKEKMKKVLIVEHNHEISPDYLLEVIKDENDISTLNLK